MRMEASVSWRTRDYTRISVAAAVPRKSKAILNNFLDEIRPVEAHEIVIVETLRDITRRAWKGKP